MAKKKKKAKKSKPKEKEYKERKEQPEPVGTKPEVREEIEEVDYRKEMIKTFLPLLFGIVAGFISFLISGDMRSRDPMGIIVLVLFIYINKFLMPRYGVELKGKDWAGIGFMTFTTWYIIWTLLLNLQEL
jgi:hypothetical protein